MKEILVYYARCNRQINTMMLDILAKEWEEPFAVALEGYWFKTLGQLLEHILVSDLIWMKAFSDLETAGLSLEDEVRAVPSYGDRPFTTFAEYRQARELLDDFICRYMEAADPSLSEKTVSRRTKDGQLMVKQASKALVHFFNHQTHHRGQVSAILDARSIENNYSNMIFLDL